MTDEFEDFRKTLADDLLNARADADEARMMQRILQGKNRELERALIINATARGNVPHAAKTQSSFLPDQNTILDGTKEEVANVGGQTKRAELSARPPDNDKANFAHNQIDERLILQLAGLEERRKKLLLLRENGTQNLKNAELIRKIENAIAAIETNVRSDSERNDA